MLWGSGDPSRVMVKEVLGDSAAARLGIRVGDQVLRYDGERVFDVNELVYLTRASGSAGSVAVELIRDGKLVRTTAPRGTLGIVLERGFERNLEAPVTMTVFDGPELESMPVERIDDIPVQPAREPANARSR